MFTLQRGPYGDKCAGAPEGKRDQRAYFPIKIEHSGYADSCHIDGITRVARRASRPIEQHSESWDTSYRASASVRADDRISVAADTRLNHTGWLS